MRTKCLSVLTVCLLGCTENSSAARAKEQLEALQKKKAEQAKERDNKPPPPVAPAVKLPPPYDDAQATVVMPDGPCPEGWWALFPGPAPGASAEERAANESRRKDLAKRVGAQQYLVKLRAPTQVKMNPFDAPAGKFEIEVLGTVDCIDAQGRVAIAWTTARAEEAANSAARADAEMTQRMWRAEPLRFDWPVKGLSEAKALYDANRFGLSARIAFTLGPVEVDKKIRAVKKVTEKVGEETLTVGGSSEDWGAGRLVRGQLLGARVASEGESKMLFERLP